jgi:cyanophycin synthetase
MLEKQRVTPKTARRSLRHLRPLLRLLAEAAVEAGYQVWRYSDSNLITVRHRGQVHHMNGVRLPINNYAAALVADNKLHTSAILHAAGIPVAKSLQLTRTTFQAGRWNVRGLRFPLVVKPVSGTIKGQGIITDVRDERALRRTLREGFRSYPKLLVEEYYGGLNDFRVLVLDGKVIGVLHRIPAYVVGDGRSTLRQLITAKNAARARFRPITLGPIEIDTELRNVLRRSRLRLTSTPRHGVRVQLKNVCNLGAGGEVHDVTEQIHPKNVHLAIRATRELDLRLAGLDFLCSDISRPFGNRNTGVILEINQHPDFGMHHFPQAGAARPVAAAIMKAVFSKPA